MTCRLMQFAIGRKTYSIRLPHEMFKERDASAYAPRGEVNAYGVVAYRKQQRSYGERRSYEKQQDYMMLRSSSPQYSFMRTPIMPEPPGRNSYPAFHLHREDIPMQSLSPNSYLPPITQQMMQGQNLPINPPMNLPLTTNLQTVYQILGMSNAGQWPRQASNSFTGTDNVPKLEDAVAHTPIFHDHIHALESLIAAEQGASQIPQKLPQNTETGITATRRTTNGTDHRVQRIAAYH